MRMIFQLARNSKGKSESKSILLTHFISSENWPSICQPIVAAPSTNHKNEDLFPISNEDDHHLLYEDPCFNSKAATENTTRTNIIQHRHQQINHQRTPEQRPPYQFHRIRLHPNLQAIQHDMHSVVAARELPYGNNVPISVRAAQGVVRPRLANQLGIPETLQPNPTPSVCEGETHYTVEQQPECCGFTTEQINQWNGNTDDTKIMQSRNYSTENTTRVEAVAKSITSVDEEYSKRWIHPMVASNSHHHSRQKYCQLHLPHSKNTSLRGRRYPCKKG